MSSMLAAITATGAVTSVGLTAVASSAAIRADVSRPHPIEFPFVDAETQELVPLTGHPVVGYTDGFQLLGRWVRLARGAMIDLLAQPGVPPVEDAAFWGRTALAAVTPRPDDDVFLTETGGALAAIQADFVGLLSKVLRIQFAPMGVELVPRAHAGAILAAEAWLARLGPKPEAVESYRAEDLRLLVCRALEGTDPDDFESSLGHFLREERKVLDELYDLGHMAPEAAATERHLSVVGLALTRLAEAAGLSLAAEYPGIPSPARDGGSIVFSGAWTSIP
jgi:hypothetical protein